MSEVIIETKEVSQPLKSFFQIGEKLIVVAEKNLFDQTKGFDDLHFVELEIIEEKKVFGNYSPKEQFFGYKAKGSDGWEYTCQWGHFDETLDQPYALWKRHFLIGKHYLTNTKGQIIAWLIDNKKEFIPHFINRDIKTCAWLINTNRRNVDGLVLKINTLFPNNEISFCNINDHKNHGIFYKRDGCFLCNHDLD